MKRILRTYTSEQYAIHSDTISGLVGLLDVHIQKNVITCRLILLQNIAETYEVASIKDYICSFLEELTEEDLENEAKDILVDVYSGNGLGLYSSKTECVLPND